MYLNEPVNKLEKELEKIARSSKYNELDSDLAFFGSRLLQYLRTKTIQKHTSVEQLIEEHSRIIAKRTQPARKE